MFLIAFDGFLHVGEFTVVSTKKESHCLQISDIGWSSDGFVIKFRSYKHSVPSVVENISVSPQSGNTCPVYHLQKFLAVRGAQKGCLFINPSGTPVARSQFTEALHGALSFVGLSPMKYKGHSFRIGAATWAMQLGKSDAQIRSSGCWHSNAFLKYIRPDNSCLK